ncbi:helitron_like_N domain-containing protein [Trichonephila clavipes]|nr:helitron_like_N domain-containing protein [Trichonephila clavipes]
MYVEMEEESLRFIALNQMKKKLRAENYIHLQDAIKNDADLDQNNLVQMVILPSSFINSVRYLPEYTQDAFTSVRNCGRRRGKTFTTEQPGGSQMHPTSLPFPPTSQEDIRLNGYLEYPHAAKTLYIHKHPYLLLD